MSIALRMNLLGNIILCGIISIVLSSGVSSDLIIGHVESCPHYSQFNYRQMAVCNGIDKAYICVEDLSNGSYIELCTEQHQIQRPGYKVVLNRNFDSIECNKSLYYQPIRYNTSDGSECQSKQSVCNEEGQVVATGGTTISDKTCRCDHTRGYAFIIEPSNFCYCQQSIEDCSCYKKTCPISQELMADYTCKRKGEHPENCKCFQSDLSEVENKRNLGCEHESLLNLKSGLPEYQLEERCRFDLCTAFFIALTLVIALLIQVGLLLCFVKTGQISIQGENYKIKIRFKKNSICMSDDGKGPTFSKPVTSNKVSKVSDNISCMDSTVDIKPKVAIMGSKNTSETIESLLGVNCLQNFEVNESNKPGAVLLALEFGCLPEDVYIKFVRCLQTFENAVKFIVVFVSNDEVSISECLDKVPELKYAVEKSEIRCFSYCKTYTHDTCDTQKLQYSKDMKLTLLKAINYCRLNDSQQCDTSHNTEQLIVVQNGVENGGIPPT